MDNTEVANYWELPGYLKLGPDVEIAVLTRVKLRRCVWLRGPDNPPVDPGTKATVTDCHRKTSLGEDLWVCSLLFDDGHIYKGLATTRVMPLSSIEVLAEI